MFDFDKQIDRRGTNSLKWNKYKDQDEETVRKDTQEFFQSLLKNKIWIHKSNKA
jgi:bifunctional pyridoxal-dependent enzyme with beta-cystathionase and maltose regulon repressor activities